MCHQALVKLPVAKFHENLVSASNVICERVIVANLEVHFLYFLYEYGIKIPEPVYVNEIIFQMFHPLNRYNMEEIYFRLLFPSSSHLTCQSQW